MSVMNDRLNLSKAEKRFLSRFHRNAEKIYVNYIMVGLSLCVAIVGLILAFELGRSEGFLIAIIFGGMSVNLFIISRSHQKLHMIITKMMQHIEQLEDGDLRNKSGT